MIVRIKNHIPQTKEDVIEIIENSFFSSSPRFFVNIINKKNKRPTFINIFIFFLLQSLPQFYDNNERKKFSIGLWLR